MKNLEEKSSLLSSFDGEMMDIALRMAERGLGTTSPNPSVGAVLANEKTKEVIARGWTQVGGRPHAETEALRRAGGKAKASTLYVTLEPCAHRGVTPPCVDALIAAHIKRVVIGLLDPDPRTSGKGIQILKEANIDVTVGLRERQAEWITMGHILRLTERRPLVSLKIATDKQGFVPSGNGSMPLFVTGPKARAAGHWLRCQADAILIGSGTLYGDNPDLTCRLPGLENRSPQRILLSGKRKIPLDCKIIQTAKKVPVLLISNGSNVGNEGDFKKLGVELIPIKTDPQGVNISVLLELLAARGITRLLVEGGPKIWHSFSLTRTVDEIFHFHASSNLTEIQSKKILENYLPFFEFNVFEHRQIGEDTFFHWRRRLINPRNT